MSKINVPGTLVIVALLLLWEAAVRGGAVAYDYLPAPSAIFVAGRDLLISGEMLAQTAHTLASVLIGWAVAYIIGMASGWCWASPPFARRYSWLRWRCCVRCLSWLSPLALLLFNFSLTTELVLIIYASVWPVLINTMGGVMSVAAAALRRRPNLRLSRARILRKSWSRRRAGHRRRLPAEHGATR